MTEMTTWMGEKIYWSFGHFVCVLLSVGLQFWQQRADGKEESKCFFCFSDGGVFEDTSQHLGGEERPLRAHTHTI